MTEQKFPKDKIEDEIKKKINNFTSLQKTLFLPIYARTTESIRENPIIKDTYSSFVLMYTLSLINYDEYKKYDKKALTCGIVRTKILDEEVKRIIDDNKKITIVNLGCGLCTRFFRLECKNITWIDIDLDEVITLKKHLLKVVLSKKPENYHLISRSVFDSDWIDDVKLLSKSSKFLIVAEGLFIYFTRSEVQKIIVEIVNKFDNVELLFESSNSLMSFVSRFPKSMRVLHTRFKLKLPSYKTTEKWDDKIVGVGEYFYYHRYKERWGIYRLLDLFKFTRRSLRIDHIKSKSSK